MPSIGFTGTRQGMTPAQTETFMKVLELLLGPSLPTTVAEMHRAEFHHGDCAGADAQAHAMVATTYGLWTDIHIHPPTNSSLRAFCDQIERPEGRRGMTLVMHPPRSFLERNHDIVDASEVLVAIPKETEEVLRSGTWATIRYAHKLRRRVMIIYPNGFTRSES